METHSRSQRIAQRNTARLQAQTCAHKNNFSGAIQHAREAFIISGEVFGSQHWEVLEESIFLAQIYIAESTIISDSRRNEEQMSYRNSALSFLHHAASVLVSKASHPIAEIGIKCCHVVARLYAKLQEVESADSLMHQSVKIAEARYGDASVETASVFSDISVYFVGRGAFSSALHYAGKALVIFVAKRGPAHRATAEAQYRVALIFRFRAQFSRARKEFQFARGMFVLLYGENSLETARVDVSLGFTLQMIQLLNEAERFYKRALLVRERRLGPDHRLTIEVHTLLSEIQQQLGRHHADVSIIDNGKGIETKIRTGTKQLDYGNSLPANTGSLDSILGHELGQLFGPGSGYGILGNSSHGDQSYLHDSLLREAVYTDINTQGDTSATIGKFHEGVENVSSTNSPTVAQFSYYKSQLDVLEEQLERDMQKSYESGGASGDAAALRSKTDQNATGSTLWQREHDEMPISEGPESRLMGKTYTLGNFLVGQGTLTQTSNYEQSGKMSRDLLSTNSKATVTHSLMQRDLKFKGMGQEYSGENIPKEEHADNAVENIGPLQNAHDRGFRGDNEYNTSSESGRGNVFAGRIGHSNIEGVVDEVARKMYKYGPPARNTEDFEEKSSSVLQAGTMQVDFLGRRVKVLALNGDELLSLMSEKLCSIGIFITMLNEVRQRRLRQKLLCVGLFLNLLKAISLRRRAARIAAFGFFLQGSIQRQLRITGSVLCSVGIFLGIRRHSSIVSSLSKSLEKSTNNKIRPSGTKYKQVNFTKEDLVAHTENTIFEKRSAERERRDSFMEMATLDLETDFAKKSVTKKSTPNKLRPKRRRANLLPEKDGKKMSMVAFQLTKAHTWEELVDVIEGLEYESLSLDALEALAKPNGACQDIMRFKTKVLNWRPAGKQTGPFTDADFKMLTSAELMVFHLGKIEDLSQRTRSMLYCKSFDENLKPLDANLNVLIRACREVMTSKRLPTIMHYVLMLTNHLNQGGRNANISGIRLSGLGKLCITKSAKGQTLLHFMIDKLFIKSPDLLMLEADFPSLAAASILSSTTMRSERDTISNGFKNLVLTMEDAADNEDDTYETKFSDFRDRAEVLVDALEEKYDEAMRVYKEACEYLAEDPIKLTFEAYFKLLRSFVDTFRGQRSHAEKLRERNAKRRLKEEAKKKKEEEENEAAQTSSASRTKRVSTSNQLQLSGKMPGPAKSSTELLRERRKRMSTSTDTYSKHNKGRTVLKGNIVAMRVGNQRHDDYETDHRAKPLQSSPSRGLEPVSETVSVDNVHNLSSSSSSNSIDSSDESSESSISDSDE